MHEEPVSALGPTGWYFLLSYPHTPYTGNGNGNSNGREPDYWVEKFFTDLRRALEEQGVPRQARLGVFDRDLWVLNDWRRGLPEALANCRVMVALCAPRYFQSLACGKEWAAFAGRPIRKDVPGAVPPIIPVMWKPMKPAEVPVAARAVPFEYWGLASYMEFGLESIIMRTRHRADYNEVVRRVAERVKALAEAAAPPCGVVDYDQLPSPFASGVGPMLGDHPLRITVVAPGKGDLPAGRGERYYGPAALDWNPYLPESPDPGAGAPEPIAEYAANCARSQGFRPYVGDLREHRRHLLNGHPPAAPELLIVDPWAVTQPACADLLIRSNLSAKPWVQLVIPWNRDDRELAAAEDTLRRVLDSAFGPKLGQVRVTAKLAVDGVPDLAGFRAVLPGLMLAAKKHYFRYAEVPGPLTPPERTGG